MEPKNNFLFSNFSCFFDNPRPPFREIVIFYLNFLKAVKFALKVINMNRPAPNCS